MKLLLHYLTIYRLILFRDHACSRTSLAWNYSRLLFQAHTANLAGKSSSSPLTIKLFGKRVFFHSYVFLCFQFEEIFVLDCYRSRTSKTKKLIIDGGGNIGMAALYFTTVYPNAEIISFEPDPASFQLLSQFVSVNQLSRVRLVNAALAPEKGRTVFYTYPQPSGNLNAGLYQSQGKKLRVEVQAVILSEYVSMPIDLLKLDVEGAEVSVIHELIASHTISRINEIVLEFHPKINGTSEQLIKSLYELNFTLHHSKPLEVFTNTVDYLLHFTNQVSKGG